MNRLPITQSFKTAITCIVFLCNYTFYSSAQVIITEEKCTYYDHSFELYTTKLSEIEDIFGTTNRIVDWNGFSYEHMYKKEGISFTYEQADSLDRYVYWIDIWPKKHDIQIDERMLLTSKSTVQDIVEILGETNLRYNKKNETLALEYWNFDLYIQLKSKDIKQLTSQENEIIEWEDLPTSIHARKIDYLELY